MCLQQVGCPCVYICVFAHAAAMCRSARSATRHTPHTIFTQYYCWAEAPIKIARMTLTAKLDGNWSSFQLANSAPPLSVTGGATAPSARMLRQVWRSPPSFSLSQWVPFQLVGGEKKIESRIFTKQRRRQHHACSCWGREAPQKFEEVTLMRPIHGNL